MNDSFDILARENGKQIISFENRYILETEEKEEEMKGVIKKYGF